MQIIDTSIGAPTSNSYVTIEEFRDYIGGSIIEQDFEEVTDDRLISILLRATRDIDSNLNVKRGTIANDNQALLFPRNNLTDIYNRRYDNDKIPTPIKNAQIEQAIHVFFNYSKPSSLLSGGFSKAKLDVMEITVDSKFVSKKISDDSKQYLDLFGTVVNSSGLCNFKLGLY